MGVASLGAAIPLDAFPYQEIVTLPEMMKNPRFRKPGNPITAIVLGAGSRGNVYSSYTSKFPEEIKIIGVAEPIDYRRENFSKTYDIPKQNQWVTWEHALQVPKLADVVIITMPDHLHYPAAIEALKLKYDLLLEKAIAQTWEECKHILEETRKNERIVAVCHVLRYTPYFRKMKEVVESGRLGDVVSVQHLEPVEHIHMSHSFVRGNWRNSKESTPMILSKSCHDTDILRWVIGKECKKVSSFGSLKHFRKENAPEGSAKKCLDCKVERECIFSAVRLYADKKEWLGHLMIENRKRETILKALRTGQYGNCVYHNDNDVVDHQIMNMQFEDDITVSFSMEAFTSYAGRRTRIFGTKGDLVGDEHLLTISDFASGQKEIWDTSKNMTFQASHGGGDYGLVHDFVQAVSQQDETLLTSTIEASMESHLMGFKAEESRLDGGKVLETKI